MNIGDIFALFYAIETLLNVKEDTWMIYCSKTDMYLNVLAFLIIHKLTCEHVASYFILLQVILLFKIAIYSIYVSNPLNIVYNRIYTSITL